MAHRGQRPVVPLHPDTQAAWVRAAGYRGALYLAGESALVRSVMSVPRMEAIVAMGPRTGTCDDAEAVQRAVHLMVQDPSNMGR